MRRALVLALALMIPACTRDFVEQDPFAQPELSGAVHIPLSSTRADGTTYLLRGATVEIGGAAMLTLSARERGQQSEEALTTQLPPGSYTLFLRPGFRLVEVDPSGTEHVVEGALAGDNPQHFMVRELEDATLKLRFAHGDSSERNIVFGVREPVRVTRAF